MAPTTADIRETFLEFFQSKNHKIVPSAPLVPGNDPTLMFTNAGMVQFKDVFIGRRKGPASRVTTVQKCIRTSGKHNDLENVGRTSRHHTFFEMLGNFSFGDYFKRDACRFAWDLLTDRLGLDPQRLWVSVFAGDENAPADEEAAAIWRDEIGVPEERIIRGEAKDNFWSMGDTGPCGPCSEIHYDRGSDYGSGGPENQERLFELWNLVFMQYNVERRGEPMKRLPAPCVDTGAGLERIASVLQGVDSNYDIDLFKPLIERAADLAGKRYGDDDEADVSIRVIADHARMAAFLISEGVFPEKTGREYVLRRVMRRAIRHGHRLGIGDLFMHDVAAKVVDGMGKAYPELVHRVDLIDKICRQEEERFRFTLERGLELIEKNQDWLAGPDGARQLPGELAFDLTATYGFPKDLIEVIGTEDGFSIDEDGYQRAEERHRAVSGAGKIGEEDVALVFKDLHASLGDSKFTGYGESLAATTQVLAMVRDSETISEGREGDEVGVILAETPFYGEAGGQVGDTGQIVSKDGTMTVTDTKRPISGLWVHWGRIAEGRVRVGDEVSAEVDAKRRDAIRRHHTATHLLHLALRKVLGSHATQKGSRVAPESLRFDFAHFQPLSWEQIVEIERLVTADIIDNHKVETVEADYAEARASGATALFEETYGDTVRVVSASDESKELCGGTHTEFTGMIGAFHIVSETGIASGVRRIEAVAGMAALDWSLDQRKTIDRAAGLFKTSPAFLVESVEKALAKEKEMAREIDRLKRMVAGGAADLTERVRDIGGIKVLGARLGVGDPASLRDAADELRKKTGSGAVCLGGDNNGKAALVVSVSEDLKGKLDARQLVNEVAKAVGGRGGGRADLAQAGGPELGNLDAAIEAIYDVVANAIGAQARKK